MYRFKYNIKTMNQVKLLILKNNVELFCETYDNHIQAKKALFMKMFELADDAIFSNAGEYTEEYYNQVRDKCVPGFTADLPIMPKNNNMKDNKEYSYGKFNYGQVFPDMMNHLRYMCENVIEKIAKDGTYEIRFIVVPLKSTPVADENDKELKEIGHIIIMSNNK